MYSPQAQMINQIVVLGLVMIFIGLLRLNIGLAPTVIVGGSAAIGFFCWRATNLRQPIHPLKTTIVFLLTTAALHVHMYEEHDCLFGPAMSRLFEIAFPDARFLQIFVFILPAIYYLTAIGLLLRIPLAGFIAWFIFIGPGIAEFTHFIVGMENHHVAVTGTYYFPGLYTAIIPMIPGIYAVYWLFKSRQTASP
jgi:hypothetical protein